MKYIKQLLYILAFCLAGQALEEAIPLPIPAAIYGLVLLFIALCAGILRPEAIADTAHFLIRLLPLLFVAPCVQILQHWGVIAPNLGPALVITVVSTWVVFAVSGMLTQWLLKTKGGDRND